MRKRSSLNKKEMVKEGNLEKQKARKNTVSKNTIYSHFPKLCLMMEAKNCKTT